MLTRNHTVWKKKNAWGKKKSKEESASFFNYSREGEFLAE